MSFIKQQIFLENKLQELLMAPLTLISIITCNCIKTVKAVAWNKSWAFPAMSPTPAVTCTHKVSRSDGDTGH